MVPALCYLIIAGGAWRLWRTSSGWRTVGARTLAFAVTFGVVVAGYGWYFHAQTGEWGLTRTTANVLYGRTAVVADCDKLTLDALTVRACPVEPLGQRMKLDEYAHIQGAAVWRARFPPGTDLNAVQRAFGWAVIDQQPLDVARAIGLDFLKGFRPTRTDAPGDNTVNRWQFPRVPWIDVEHSTNASREFSGRNPTNVVGLAEFLRGYQLSVGYTPGTLLGAFGLVALLAGFGLGRARRERHPVGHATGGRHRRDHSARVGSVRILLALPAARPRAPALRGRAGDYRVEPATT